MKKARKQNRLKPQKVDKRVAEINEFILKEIGYRSDLSIVPQNKREELIFVLSIDFGCDIYNQNNLKTVRDFSIQIALQEKQERQVDALAREMAQFGFKQYKLPPITKKSPYLNPQGYKSFQHVLECFILKLGIKEKMWKEEIRASISYKWAAERMIYGI